MKKIVLLFAFGILAGCSGDGDSAHVQVRVFNSSPQLLKNVKVNFTGGGKDYGNIDVQHASAYKDFDTAYHYGHVHAEAGGQAYELAPVDFMGETPVAGGKYTYYLDLENISGEYIFTATLQKD